MELLKSKEDSAKSYAYLRISKEQDEVLENLQKRVQIKLDDMSLKVSITVEMQDPLIAAQVTDAVLRNLTNYIVNYRTKKFKDNYDFINDRCQEAKATYKETQLKLANFRDLNRNVILSSTKSEEERLQAEYNLAFNIYNGLAQQTEQAKIKIQEKTPIFSIMKPIQIPVEKSKPKKIIIIILSFFLGIIAGISFIAGKRILSSTSAAFEKKALEF
jgi:uncharacterized protein involved in exopolysaccharide biosynthesis